VTFDSSSLRGGFRMEKDWKEKKQILNAEIRTLIIARLLSCVVIAGLLLGVLPFWAAILLVGVMWNVNFIVGGSIIYEYDLLVFLGDNKLGAIMVVASDMVFNAFIWMVLVSMVNFWILLVIIIGTIMTTVQDNARSIVTAQRYYPRLPGFAKKIANVRFTIANARFVTLVGMPIIMVFGANFNNVLAITLTIFLAAFLCYVQSMIMSFIIDEALK
jgi:membrane protein